MENSIHKLRILWVTSYVSWGGAIFSSLTKMSSLVDLGFDCRLCAPPGSYIGFRCKEYGIEHHPISIPTLKTNPFITLKSLYHFIQFTRVLCEKIKPDVIVGIDERSQIYLTLLRLTGTHLPQVWEMHQHWKVFRVIYRLIGWVPQKFIAVSNSVKRFYSIPKTVVLPNGIKLPADIRPLNGRLDEMLTSSFIVGIFARLNRLKGIHILIKAIARLRLENLPVHLMIFGERSILDPGYADELKMMVKSEGLQEWITFRGFSSDAINSMRQCDVIVSCSLSRFGGPEAFPMTVLEAWFAGIPIIATAVGGTTELVEHRRNGILVPEDDPLALARAIRLLIEDRKLAKRITKGGRESLLKYESHNTAKLFGDTLLVCVHKGF